MGIPSEEAAGRLIDQAKAKLVTLPQGPARDRLLAKIENAEILLDKQYPLQKPAASSPAAPASTVDRSKPPVPTSTVDRGASGPPPTRAAPQAPPTVPEAAYAAARQGAHGFLGGFGDDIAADFASVAAPGPEAGAGGIPITRAGGTSREAIHQSIEKERLGATKKAPYAAMVGDVAATALRYAILSRLLPGAGGLMAPSMGVRFGAGAAGGVAEGAVRAGGESPAGETTKAMATGAADSAADPLTWIGATAGAAAKPWRSAEAYDDAALDRRFMAAGMRKGDLRRVKEGRGKAYKPFAREFEAQGFHKRGPGLGNRLADLFLPTSAAHSGRRARAQMEAAGEDIGRLGDEADAAGVTLDPEGVVRQYQGAVSELEGPAKASPTADAARGRWQGEADRFRAKNTRVEVDEVPAEPVYRLKNAPPPLTAPQQRRVVVPMKVGDAIKGKRHEEHRAYDELAQRKGIEAEEASVRARVLRDAAGEVMPDKAAWKDANKRFAMGKVGTEASERGALSEIQDPRQSVRDTVRAMIGTQDMEQVVQRGLLEKAVSKVAGTYGHDVIARVLRDAATEAAQYEAGKRAPVFEAAFTAGIQGLQRGRSTAEAIRMDIERHRAAQGER